jgi:hypothetical protein
LENELMRVDPTTAVVRGQPAAVGVDVLAGTRWVGVYQLGADGPLGIPTGLIFVRFDSGSRLEEHLEQLRAAGFEVDRESALPGAGWVRHRSGACADALRQSTRLHEVDGIVTVEPEFLMARQARRPEGPSGRRRR